MGFTSTRSRNVIRPVMRSQTFESFEPFRTETAYENGEGERFLSQTTTSYRSGSPKLGERIVDDEADLLSGGTAASTFKKLKASDRAAPQSPFDTGHEFSSERSWIEAPRIRATNFVGFAPNRQRYRFDGIVRSNPSSHNVSGSSFVPVPSIDLGYYGPTAIARCKPTNPNVDLLVTLAELRREGFNSLSGAVKSARDRDPQRTVGGTYLGYEFGLKPLGSDLGKLAASVLDSQKIIKQYLRDSGRIVRRRTRFADLVETKTFPAKSGSVYVSTNSTGCRPFVGYTSQAAPGQLVETERITRKVSFSGAFQYHVHTGPGFLNRMQRTGEIANHVLGLDLSPEVLWNLAPWSWLSDWNANIGDFLSNVESFGPDSLVLKYGYIMCETRTEREVVVTGPRTHDGRGPVWVTRYVRVRKERFRASPFGFGTKPESFTNRQWSILAALGMSKGPRLL